MEPWNTTLEIKKKKKQFTRIKNMMKVEDDVECLATKKNTLHNIKLQLGSSEIVRAQTIASKCKRVSPCNCVFIAKSLQNAFCLQVRATHFEIIKCRLFSV